MSKAITREEARKMFLDEIYSIKEYWEKEEVTNDTIKGRLEGCIFSILVLIDGGHIGFPAMEISMHPHPDDEQYHKDHDENWFEMGQLITDDVVELHDMWAKVRAEKTQSIEMMKCPHCKGHGEVVATHIEE